MKIKFVLVASIILLALVNVANSALSNSVVNPIVQPEAHIVDGTTITEAQGYQKGDVNLDGIIDVNDVYFLIDYKFKDGAAPQYSYLADFNSDGTINILDIIELIKYLKGQGIIVDFQIGDVNKDGKIDLDDVYFLIDYKFREGESPDPLYLGDFNQDGIVNILDILSLIKYLKENNLLDNIAPTINLLNPSDNKIYKTSDSDKDISFEFSFEDESVVSSCELIINGEVYKAFSESTNSGTEKASINLDRDDYDWKVSCTDIFGNTAVSQTRDFEIKKKSSSSDDENDNYVSPHIPKTQNPITKFPETTNTIELNPQTKEQQVEFAVEYLIPIFLILLIILVLIMIFAVNSRKQFF